MRQHALLISLLTGLPIILAVVVFAWVFPANHPLGGNNAKEEKGPIMSIHQEGNQAMNIEIPRTGYEEIDNWLTNRANEIKTQYEKDTEGLELDLQTPILQMSTHVNEWEKYVNATLSVYTYTGGAHGYPYVNTVVLNKETGTIIGLSDLFETEGYLAKLSSLMIRKVSDLHEVFDGPTIRDALSPSATHFEVWTVGPDGITFLFNPYEIAPYSAGIIPVTVSWEEVQEITASTKKK